MRRRHVQQMTPEDMAELHGTDTKMDMGSGTCKKEDYQTKSFTLISIIITIILLNVISMYFCISMGCYKISFINMFRVNLLCNVCTDISYNLYKYQMEIYLGIGGFIIKIFSDVVTNTISGIK